MKDVVRGRVPILSGVAEITTRMACRYAADCEKIGIDGLMVLPAMIYKADRGEALGHFRSVSRASGLPVMIYNILPPITSM
ncbi:MAG: dihydrodipicolinate synthase family protein [Anaeromyxobacter sp.]